MNSKGGKAIIVEYKSNGSEKLKKKGRNQLEVAVDFYQKIKKIPTKGRLITGDDYPILRNNKSSQQEGLKKGYVNKPWFNKIIS